MKTKPIKPILIAAGAALLGLLLVKGVIAWNLHDNAYYYATHMPHEKNEYPIVRELEYCRLPESINKDYPNGYNEKLRRRSGIAIHHLFKKGDLWEVSDWGLFYYPVEKYDEQYIAFYFDKNYKIINHDIYDLTLSKSERARILHVLDRLKKESPEPLINLQKIYNKRVKKRPNPEADYKI